MSDDAKPVEPENTEPKKHTATVTIALGPVSVTFETPDARDVWSAAKRAASWVRGDR